MKLKAKPSEKVVTYFLTIPIYSPFQVLEKRHGWGKANKPQKLLSWIWSLGQCSCFVIGFIENAVSLIDVVGKKVDFVSWWTRTKKAVFCALLR